MSMLPTKSLARNGGVVRNSYYDVREPYTQSELDEYRISEGYSKEVRLRLKSQENMED